MRVTLEDIYVSSGKLDMPFEIQQHWDKTKPELENIIDRLEDYVGKEAEEW